MTEIITELTPEQVRAGRAVDALDLEPIVFRLTRAEPGESAVSLAEADRLIAGYRCYLKLCAWYPQEPVVPTRAIDHAWHAHILDTAKYAADCQAVFGYFLDHFPYFGLRGADDEAALRDGFARTAELFQARFGITLGGTEADCQDGSLCVPEGTECDKRAGTLPSGQAGGSCSTSCQAGTGEGNQCSSSGCHGSTALDQARPRPDRSVAAA